MADFHAIAVSPIDAQLDRQREWSARDIATAFGVSPYFLGIPGDSGTYANIENRFIELRQFTLMPWVRKIEAALDSQVPRGQSFKVKFDGLMRADTRTRMEAYKVAIDAGILTVDEVRALEDRPPVDEATMQQEDPALPAVPVLGEPALTAGPAEVLGLAAGPVPIEEGQ
jgi:HK97 family phage portal protein